jgi:ABC-type nitrate/sulfonate/bicarbonate transport system substrate-binding protein
VRLTWRSPVLTALAVVALAGCGGAASVSGSIAPSSAAGASSAAPASSVPAAASASSIPVRLAASQNVTSNAPIWLTPQAGLFQKNGLNANLASINATTAIKQLVAGQLDGLAVGGAESISARAAGSQIQIVAVFQQACDMVMVAPNNVTSVDQFKGKTIGVITKPSVNGICTVADLRKHGLQDSDYKIVETGSASAYASLLAGLESHNVDAGALSPDFARKLASGGQFHILYDLATEPGLLTAASSLTFGSAFIQAHPTEVQKTVDSFLQGEAYFKQHKDEAQGILKSIFKLTDPAELDNVYTRQVQLMAKDITPRTELFPDLISALGQVQPDVKTMDLNGLLAPQFAQSAIQRGLTNF